jgi:hypothetical protein
MRPDLEYVLPMRWSDDADLPELAAYARWLADVVDVMVVDVTVVDVTVVDG